jgi:hypothetical protein
VFSDKLPQRGPMPAFKTDFQSVMKDAVRWVEDHGPRSTIDRKRVNGLLEVRLYVISVYQTNEAWDALIDHLNVTSTHWSQVPELKRLIDALRERRDSGRLKRLLGSMIAKHKEGFWSHRSFCKKGRIAGTVESKFYKAADEEMLSRKKADLLLILRDTRRIMMDLGETQFALKLDEDDTCIEQETRKKLSKAIDRPMNEECFWELIESAKRRSKSIAEQMVLLETALEGFKAAEIRKFKRILDAQLDSLLHWDVWALGHVAMGGCSDDAFDYFRCWLILQGKRVVSTARDDVEKLKRLPSGILEAEALLSLPGAAYESRSGKPLLLATRKARPVKGEEWEESDLKKRYPILCKLYA